MQSLQAGVETGGGYSQVSNKAAQTPETVVVERQKTFAETKNDALEVEFKRRVTLATRNTLDELRALGNFPEIKLDENEKYDKETFKFVRKIIKDRSHPSNKSKRYASSSHSHAQRLVGMLYPNIDENFRNKKAHDNFVAVEKSKISGEEGSDKVVEIHYGALETKPDRAFVDQIITDPELFLKEKLNILKRSEEEVELKIILHYPKGEKEDRTIMDKVQRKMIENMIELQKKQNSPDQKNSKGIILNIETRQLPFFADTFKDLDKTIDSHKSETGRHAKESYLEIRKNDVISLLKEIASELTPNSPLLDLMKSNPQDFIDEVYKSLKTYKEKGLSPSLGYIFEAAVLVEMKQNGVLAKEINNLIGVNNEVEQDESAISFSSDEFEQLNQLYRVWGEKSSSHHGDFIIARKNIRIDTNQTVVAILECKSSSLDKLKDNVREQIAEEINSLDEFIKSVNKDESRKISSLGKNSLSFIVVKPQNTRSITPTTEITTPQTVEGKTINILRSSVTSKDLEVVHSVIERNQKKSPN